MPELTCVICPLGCRLSVTLTPEGVQVSGNSCPRGKAYAIEEITAPKRILTEVIKVKGRDQLLPVRTATVIPKELLFTAMEEIKKLTVTPPVNMDEVVMANLAGTGVDLVATKPVA